MILLSWGQGIAGWLGYGHIRPGLLTIGGTVVAVVLVAVGGQPRRRWGGLRHRQRAA